MLKYKTGDILTADTEALVNTVNCVGVMGRGIAQQFKRAFPRNFEAYAEACRRNELEPGKMFVFDTGELHNPRYIINFPTKRHWRGKSRLEDIESGLDALAKEIRQRSIRSVAVPPLGTGLGGLDWIDVAARIENALSPLDDVEVHIYKPQGAPDPTRMARSAETPRMTPGRAALVGLVDRYLAGLIDPFVTLLEVHKLMYFMQESGESLHLRYRPALYGPYAENLRHVLTRIEGHYISGYADGGDSPHKTLELVPGSVPEAHKLLADSPATETHFNRVADLVNGFESPMGLELLATVHWVVTRERPKNLDDVVNRVHSWNDRKMTFSPRQIHIAYKTLLDHGWICGFEQ